MTPPVDGQPSTAVDDGPERSTTDGVKEGPSGPLTKLRILCLHGFRTSGNILSKQVELAKWGALHDDIAELVFIDGSWPAGGKSDVEHKFAGPYFEWYSTNEDRTEIYGLEEANAHFCDYVSSHGPFDGLLGFSQGAGLAAAWLGFSEKGLESKIPNVDNMFVIVIGGSKLKAPRFFPAYADGIKRPSLHFLGDQDFVRARGENLISIFKDPTVIRHQFGHIVPRLTESQGQIYRDFLLKQIRSKIAS